MKPQSQRIIHVGINFLSYPSPVISPHTSLAFQGKILSHGLEFSNITQLENKIQVIRDIPTPLHLTVATLDPSIGQLVIVAPNPKRPLDNFINEAEASVEAFLETWPAQNRQIIKVDATIRELNQTTGEHAFQELWENLLKQPADALKAFRRPVRGGGLRFVLMPAPEEPDPAAIEVKIESYLHDSSMIFVEAQFVWPNPSPPGTPFNIRDRLIHMNQYIQDQVHSFIHGEKNE